MIQDEIL
jgi:hypothetical protein